MQGSDRFRNFKPALLAYSRLLGFLPQSIRQIIWSASSSFSGLIAQGTRFAILNHECLKADDNIFTGEHVVIKNRRGLSIGKNASIHAFCYIDAEGGCTIGNNVSIAHNSSILTTNHTWTDSTKPIKYNPIKPNPVNIADDVWIGCGVRILAGVVVGHRSIVAAGAVVTKSIPPYSIVAGVPAKIISSTAATPLQQEN